MCIRGLLVTSVGFAGHELGDPSLLVWWSSETESYPGLTSSSGAEEVCLTILTHSLPS